MTIPSYWLGEVKRLQLTITSSTNSMVPVDPGGLSFGLREPDGTTYNYVRGVSTALVSATVGVFYVDWTMAKIGVHRGGWVGSASHADAIEFSFNVLARMY